MIVLSCVVLMMGILVYVFYPNHHVAEQTSTTKLEYLKEQRDVAFDNLRDLKFEFRAGKYFEQDYLEQRAALEDDAAEVIVGITKLEDTEDI